MARPEFIYWTEFLSNLGAFANPKRDISLPKVGKAMAITKTGQVIETKTADDITKIAAMAPDGIIMAEAAQMSYEVYLKCIGRLAERRGWLLASGTFEGSLGWYPEKFTEWQDPTNAERGKSFSLPSWSNLVIYPGGRNDPEIVRLETLYSRVEGLFDERCGAVPVPPATLVFREFRHTVHIRSDIHFNPRLPVYLAIDPSSGGDPYAVLACQFETCEYPDPVPDPIDYCNVIDEYYDIHVDTEEIIDTLRQRPWWKAVQGGAIDCEAPDERKRWLRMAKIPLISKKIDQFAGIRRLKSFLYYRKDPKTGLMMEYPHLRIASSVKALPFEFSRYKRKLSPEDNLTVIEKPPQNQPDHAVKALWYLLIARYGDVRAAYGRKVVKTWKRRM